MKKIFISAGDPSGDIHAANLMKQIIKLAPEVEFVGIGGKNMTEAGLKSLIPISEISVLGFWEVAKKYFTFIDLLNKCKEILKNDKIDLFLPIDYPGLNLKIAEYAKSISIPVVYYIAPQLWAWGKNRTKKIAQNVDKLLVVFPFEEEFFQKDGINAIYVGNPLLDIDEFKDDFLARNDRKNTIAIFPGSREQEINKHLNFLVDTAEILHNIYPNYNFIIGKSNNISENKYNNILSKYKYIYLSENTREIMKYSKVGIIKSGTSNLEACLAGLPFSLIYKTSPMTYFIGKRKINMPYLSIVNILANKRVVNEFIQNDATPENLANNTAELLNSNDKYNNMQSEFKKIRDILGITSASATAAKIILS